MRATLIRCWTGITVLKRLNTTSEFTTKIATDRQRRDRTRQLVAQLATLNTHKKLDPTEVRLLAKTLSKDDIRKYSKFETLATTICDQQDALDEAQRRYVEQVKSSSAQLAQLTRSHEARLEHEVRQAKAQIDMANDRVQANETQAQLRLQARTNAKGGVSSCVER